MEHKKKKINETIVNGSRIYVEDGEVKTVFSEDIKKSGYVDPEEARALLHAFVDKLEEAYRD